MEKSIQTNPIKILKQFHQKIEKSTQIDAKLILNGGTMLSWFKQLSKIQQQQLIHKLVSSMGTESIDTEPPMENYEENDEIDEDMDVETTFTDDGEPNVQQWVNNIPSMDAVLEEKEIPSPNFDHLSEKSVTALNTHQSSVKSETGRVLPMKIADSNKPLSIGGDSFVVSEENMANLTSTSQTKCGKYLKNVKMDVINQQQNNMQKEEENRKKKVVLTYFKSNYDVPLKTLYDIIISLRRQYNNVVSLQSIEAALVEKGFAKRA
jgi:hypothetical protein